MAKSTTIVVRGKDIYGIDQGGVDRGRWRSAVASTTGVETATASQLGAKDRGGGEIPLSARAWEGCAGRREAAQPGSAALVGGRRTGKRKEGREGEERGRRS